MLYTDCSGPHDKSQSLAGEEEEYLAGQEPSSCSVPQYGHLGAELPNGKEFVAL